MSGILYEIQKHVPDCTYHVNVGLNYLIDSIKQYKIDLEALEKVGYGPKLALTGIPQFTGKEIKYVCYQALAGRAADQVGGATVH